MKKYLFLILLGFMYFLPNNVFASTSNLTGDVLYYQQQGYYFGRPDVGNRMPSGYLNDDTYGLPIGSSNYFYVRRLDTSVNFIYGVNQMNVYPSQNVVGGKFYTIRLNIAKGGYIKINDIPSIYNISTSYTCRSNIGTCTWYWENQTMVVSFQATSSNNGTWYIILGDFHEDNKVLGLNTYTLDGQGWIVQSATITDNNSSSTTDLTPVVNSINGTNSRLDNVNNNLNNVNNNISQTNDKLDDTNEKLDSIGDTLASDSVPSGSDIDDTFSDYDVISNGPISALLQLPFNLLSRLHDSFGSTSCRTYTFGSLYGHSLTLPCIYLEDYLGEDLFNIIDTIICVFIYYNLFLLIIHFYESITSFHDYFDNLYVPKHADTGYTPKHGGDS